MSYADTRCRIYDSEAINILGQAFDKAVWGLSEQSRTDPNTRRRLAICIMRLFDEGERAPLHLSVIALSIMRRPFQQGMHAPLCPNAQTLTGSLT